MNIELVYTCVVELLSRNGFLFHRSVAEALTKGHAVLPETLDSTTVYFGGIVGFKDAIMGTKSPLETITMLNQLYSTCDAVIENFDAFKVEVVIDSYLVSGIFCDSTTHTEPLFNKLWRFRLSAVFQSEMEQIMYSRLLECLFNCAERWLV